MQKVIYLFLLFLYVQCFLIDLHDVFCTEWHRHVLLICFYVPRFTVLVSGVAFNVVVTQEQTSAENR